MCCILVKHSFCGQAEVRLAWTARQGSEEALTHTHRNITDACAILQAAMNSESAITHQQAAAGLGAVGGPGAAAAGEVATEAAAEDVEAMAVDGDADQDGDTHGGLQNRQALIDLTLGEGKVFLLCSPSL